MSKISIDIVVPRDFMPYNKDNLDQWEQYLTISLTDYLPRVLLESRDKEAFSYIAELEIVRGDIEASYREDEVYVKGGYLITVYIEKDSPPTQQPTIDIKTEIGLALFDWFGSKHVDSPRLFVDVKWKDET